MGDVRVDLNMKGLVKIANEVNDEVCKPIAERTAAKARGSAPAVSGTYRDSIHVETDGRDSASDWAHSYVVADAPYAVGVEARTGNLARALGGA